MVSNFNYFILLIMCCFYIVIFPQPQIVFMFFKGHSWKGWLIVWFSLGQSQEKNKALVIPRRWIQPLPDLKMLCSRSDSAKYFIVRQILNSGMSSGCLQHGCWSAPWVHCWITGFTLNPYLLSEGILIMHSNFCLSHSGRNKRLEWRFF